MTFERQPIDEESIAMVRQFSCSSQWDAYGDIWAIDLQTSDCLFFYGRDVLDPTIQTEFVLLTADRKDRWNVEVISSNWMPAQYLATLLSPGTPNPDYVAVLRLKSRQPPNTAPPQELAREALMVLEQRSELKVIFVPDWQVLYDVRSEISRIQFELQTKLMNHTAPFWPEFNQRFRRRFLGKE